MDAIAGVDWEQMFAVDTPLLEIFLRGSLMYLGIFALLRIIRREAGSLGVADLLVIVLIADAAQNGMAGDYTSITDGFVLVATIVGWSYALDWLAYHSRFLERLIHPAPTPLVKDGQPQWRHLREQLITEDELRSHLREQGVDDLSKVRRAYMEENGQISVITYEGERHEAPTSSAA
jgi:uncharacterized membrane protein YcaP (DUF421 family)